MVKGFNLYKSDHKLSLIILKKQIYLHNIKIISSKFYIRLIYHNIKCVKL